MTDSSVKKHAPIEMDHAVDPSDNGLAGLDRLKLLALTIENMPVGVITLDPDLKIMEMNPWAEKITGYLEKESKGNYCGNILQGGMCGSRCPLKTVLTSRKPMVRLETTIRNKEGVHIPVRLSISALYDTAGTLIGGVEVIQDISDLKALERERANLISMFAHDMKSPLVSIQGFALRMLNKGAEIAEDKRAQYLHILQKEAETLELLINDFLDFSRLETGRLNLNLSATDLDKTLLELIEVYQPRFRQAGIELEFLYDEKIPVIDADSHRLRRVFTNLLENALKFSPEKTTVSIDIEETAKEIMIRVSDQGTGIPPEELPYIFDTFYRGSGHTKHRGHGLGLAAVMKIIKAHGGRVLVSSEVGRGTVFTVTLPKERATDEPEEAQETSRFKQEDYER
ncbi:MAG: PAS domain-containing sensor histidine kinase [Deltaproteobacteria bacterium]|nr:PAS domain-containing sensor histidine kinase [Deltaproteobacteria bacterium]